MAADFFEITLDSLGRTYQIPTGGATDWRNSMSRYLRDASTVINSLSGGSLVTPVINVRNYGATGNGVADDTVAIQAAMTYLESFGLSGGSLYFPAGTYRYTSRLRFGQVSQRNVRIVGDGVSSVLKPTGAFSTNATIDFTNVDYWSISDLKIDASARTGTGDSLLVTGSSYGSLTNASLTGSTAYGLRIASGNYNTVTNNVYSSNAAGDVLVVSGIGNVVTPGDGSAQPTYVNVKNYGAAGDGITNDAPAFQAALAALWWGPSSIYGRTLFVPRGQYLLNSTLTITGKTGFRIVGEGPDATQLVAGGADGQDVLRLVGCQHLSVEDLSFVANAAGTTPSAMIHSVADGGLSSYNHRYVNITCNGTGTSDLFDYGIRYSTSGTGGNSEVTYQNVEVQKAAISCFQISGSQAKGHNFFQCIAGAAPRGLYCVDEGFGSSTANWYGGTFGAITAMAIEIENPGEPMLIESADSEACYAFFACGDGVVSTSTGQNVSIRNCRLDCSSTSPTPAFSTWIRYSGAGPFVFEGNSLFGGTDGTSIPRIALASDGISASIRNNYFGSTNSVSVSPLNWSTNSVGPSSQVKMSENTFVNAAGDLRVFRLEGLDAGLPTGFTLANPSGTECQYIIGVSPALFTAAALRQSVTLPLPQAVRIKGITLYNNNKLALPGAPDIVCRVGSASDGDEYVLDTNVSTTDQTFYSSPALLGYNLTTDYLPGSGYVPDYFGATNLYITLESSSGNLGTGAATRITGGELFILLTADIAARWLRVD